MTAAKSRSGRTRPPRAVVGSQISRDEEMFVTKEYLLDQKLKSYDRTGPRSDGGKGKGKGMDRQRETSVVRSIIADGSGGEG